MKRNAFFPAFLAFVMLLFLGLLVLTYFVSRDANPVILDEAGQVRQ